MVIAIHAGKSTQGNDIWKGAIMSDEKAEREHPGVRKIYSRKNGSYISPFPYPLKGQNGKTVDLPQGTSPKNQSAGF